MVRLSKAERERHFGPPCGGQIAYCSVWGLRVGIHVKLHDEFVHACIAAHQAGARPPLRIDSYSCRRIRHGGGWSLHAWPVAVDMFMTPPGVPPPGGVWRPTSPLDPILVKTFRDRGWTWGGTWARVDEPHLEWAGPPP
jgi:hypothetical protein